MCRYVSISVFFLIMVSGCASTPSGIDGRMLAAYEKKSTRVVESVGNDEYGRPVFGPKLKKRRLKVGDSFTLVSYSRGRPVESYDVWITDPERPDYAEPFREVGRWTKDGFMVGAAGGVFIWMLALDALTAEDASDENAGEIMDAALVLSAWSVGIGTVGGFVLGVGNAMYSLGEQIGLESQEMKMELVSYQTFLYDSRGRLKAIVDHPTAHLYDIRVTEFIYKKDRGVPSVVEKSDRWGNIIETVTYQDPL